MIHIVVGRVTTRLPRRNGGGLSPICAKISINTMNSHCEPPLGGVAIQGREHGAAALDCCVAPLLAMTAYNLNPLHT
jgi:hypothetical protein